MARHGLLDTTALTPSGAIASPNAALDVEEQPNVSEFEQQEYDQVVNNAYSLIYDDKALPGILQSMAGDGNPVKGLADTVANVLSRLNESSIQSGRNISPDVLFAAGQEIISDLADLSEKSGIHTYSDEEMEQATLLAVETFRAIQQKSGNLDPNAAAADFEEMTIAEEQGRLGELLPEGDRLAAFGSLDDVGGAPPGGAVAPAPQQPPAALPTRGGLLNG